MIRKSLLVLTAWLSACVEPPPPPVDGEIIRHAVDLAQSRVEQPRSSLSYASADPTESGR